MKKLIDICDIQYGYAFDSVNFTNDKSYLPLVRIRDVKRGYSETFYKGEYPEEYVVHKDDLLVGMDGEFNIARWRDRDALLNQRVCKISAKQDNNGEYIRFALMRILKKIEDKTAFVTVKHLSAKELNKVAWEIPGIEKQNEIANTLDILERILESRQEELKKLDDFVRARFVEMFGDSDDNWREVKIADICSDMRTGPFGSALHHDEFVDNGIFVLGIDNAVENKFSYNRMRYITEEKYEKLKRYTVQPGDVIITIMGTVGRSAVIPPDIPKAINTKHLACLTPNIEVVDSYFLTNAFQVHPAIRRQLEKQSKGAIMDGLNLTVIKNLTFRLPPLDLQKQFVDIYNQVDKSKVVVQKALDEAQLLFDSLMQQYFG
ncbi:restriction modification system DNA specificity domain protein [Clostridium sp. CAG:81]|nr:restriction modification system DNA specificity domain protein [Clostridium sp. CAG:81]